MSGGADHARKSTNTLSGSSAAGRGLAWALLSTILACCTCSTGCGAEATAQSANQPEARELKQLSGSVRQYTQAQLDDAFNAPDWFPDQHAPMPALASHGDRTRNIMACASCHLASGLGHPESANLAGLSASYQARHLAEYKSRTHFESGPMHAIADGMTEAEMQEVSAWFAAQKPRRSSRVEEADLVPASAIQPMLVMRRVIPGGGMEPINGRLIEVPDDAGRVELRDPDAGFKAYVPRGTLALGEAVAKGKAGATACATCHGDRLQGVADIPRIAGLSPDYMFRQLKAYKYGYRHGEQSAPMKLALGRLSSAELMAVAAYAGSLEP